MARQFASLDHLSGGRAAWNVVTSWDAFTDENFRRGGFLPQQARYERARTFLQTTWQLFDSWRGDEIVADQASGQFLSKANAGAFEHHDAHFDISGQFNVPRSPQGRPVIFQAGDSDAGREFAASRRTRSSAWTARWPKARPSTKTSGWLDVHRIPGHRRRGDPHLGPGGRQRRVHPRPHITSGGLDEFAATVVPLLQERGAFRSEYEGTAPRCSGPRGRAQLARLACTDATARNASRR